MKLWLQAIGLTLACLIVAALILGAMIMVADWVVTDWVGMPVVILAVAGLAGLAEVAWLFHVTLRDRRAERHGREGS